MECGEVGALAFAPRTWCSTLASSANASSGGFASEVAQVDSTGEHYDLALSEMTWVCGRNPPGKKAPSPAKLPRG